MLSKPIYEALPVVYIAAGVTTTASFQSPFATTSSVLFFASAALVTLWRHDYRKRIRLHNEAAAPPRRYPRITH